MDTVHSAITQPVRRLEVITGAGRRQKWSDEDKARIVAEIVASGDAVVWLAPSVARGSGRAFRSKRSTVCAGGGGRRGAGPRSWP
jgi:transposase